MCIRRSIVLFGGREAAGLVIL